MPSCSGVKYPLPPAVVRCTPPFGVATVFEVAVDVVDGARDGVAEGGCGLGTEVGGAARVPLVPLGAEEVAFC